MKAFFFSPYMSCVVLLTEKGIQKYDWQTSNHFQNNSVISPFDINSYILIQKDPYHEENIIKLIESYMTSPWGLLRLLLFSVWFAHKSLHYVEDHNFRFNQMYEI